uniref:PH domain-containing protein n=1 Tax=Peronospora matthiolae TaxID=2874970 RepID=A0AAV1UJC1_9STRA
MRRLSLTAMPSRRKKQQLKQQQKQLPQQQQELVREDSASSSRQSTSKCMDSQRSTSSNLSMLSSVSTCLSSDSLMSLATATSSCCGVMEDYGDADEQLEASECCEQGWMYWKKSKDCWLKMYARLRNEVLWLSKGPVGDAVAVIQIAVAGVRATDIGGIIARGPAGESMELFAYDRERTNDWVDALFVAAQLTQSYERSIAIERAPADIPRREMKELRQVYSGTLVIYNKEQKSPWKQRLRNKCRRQLEKIVDRLDTTKR